MKLDNNFSIPVPADDAWKVLLDIERIAPCVPGATITSRDGDDYHGKMKIKLGPVGLSYGGIIKILSADEAEKVVVLEGGGREARGNGTAKAVITCKLIESSTGTDVFVDTDLDITGKPAQFGRGALAEVAGTLIGTFAKNLAEELTASVAQESQAEPTAASAASDAADAPPVLHATTATSVNGAAPRKAAEPIDLLDAAGVGGVKKAAAPVLVVALLAVVLLLLRRNRNAD
ncbi:SRPBCC family protein [Aldersonia kunmingensis]|uniref:SRPBCC family protein n=1 Tax=Aldersonia kunmingensis TaxID=408066 RepID=UPI0008332D77|nr:SRPBCC family protein [Aldersonia kunmingensis]